MQIQILNYGALDSTNTEALEQARKGADEGVCIIAREQRHGRGRRERSWSSVKDSGLFFSMILRPCFDHRHFPLITLMAGVAVHETLVEFGLDPDIKWVNDVLIGTKKICGILAEATETDRGTAVILGIGINLKRILDSSDLWTTATSIENETGRSVTAVEISPVLTRHIIKRYNELSADGGPQRIIGAWTERSSYAYRKHVRVRLATDTISGVTQGVEENGALRVLKDDGVLAIVQTGDVEQLRPHNGGYVVTHPN